MTFITYAITTHNEGECIKTLLDQLGSIPYNSSEIVILDDFSTDQRTVEILESVKDYDDVIVAQSHFEGDFAEHKNKFYELANGKYIFQLDADETMSEYLLHYHTQLIQMNPEIDLFYIPRRNIVNGLTPEDIARWGWRVDEQDRVMWPDYQGRIYKNEPHINWSGKVHERITSDIDLKVTILESSGSDLLYINHVKDIDRQRKQNALYDTIT